MTAEFEGHKWLWDYLPKDQEDRRPEDDGEEDFDWGENDPRQDIPGQAFQTNGFILDEAPAAAAPIPFFRQEGQDWLREFPSWFEFVTCAADETLYAWNGRGQRRLHSSHHIELPDSWHGTKDFSTAVHMALVSGWPEGRAMLQEVLVAVATRPKVYETWEFDVAGAFPMVPLYCAGDPQCMVVDPGASLRAAKPIVRIDYNHWVRADVGTKDMMLRGAAILSLANLLEERGFSTELRIVGNSREPRQNFRYSIVYKKAGEPFDLDRAAFAIAHPASMRRLAFAILEQHADLREQFQSGYGRPMYESNDKDPNTIFVPGSRGNETPTSAMNAVREAAKSLLEELERNPENV